MFTNTTGTRSSTCNHHIFTKTVKLCSKAVSVPIGCSDHNTVAISRKAKVPKAGPKIVNKRSYKICCCYYYVDDVKIFVGLMWLIRSIQMLHLMQFMKSSNYWLMWNLLGNWLIELLRLYGLMRNWKTVWLKEMGQKEWLISLAAYLTSMFTANWETI